MRQFMILGLGRSGSTMMAATLRRMPDCAMAGEVMRTVPGDQSEKLFYDGISDPIRFLEQRVLKVRRPPAVLAVGFKLFSHHLDNLGDTRKLRFWRHLKRKKDLHVIRLSRENIVDQYISHEVSSKTGKWTLYREGCKPKRKSPGLAESRRDFDTSPLLIDTDRMLKTLGYWTDQQAWMNRSFSGHNIHYVTYEEMVADYHTEMVGVASFLGLDTTGVPNEPPTIKGNRRSQVERIKNYEQVARDLFGTPYYTFLEEKL